MLIWEFLFWWFVAGAVSAGIWAGWADHYDSWFLGLSRRTRWAILGTIVLGGMASTIVGAVIGLVLVIVAFLLWFFGIPIEWVFRKMKPADKN